MAYKLSYRVRVVAAAGVKEVTCPSHDAAARVDLTASPPTVSLSAEGGRLVHVHLLAALYDEDLLGEHALSLVQSGLQPVRSNGAVPVSHYSPVLTPAHCAPAASAVSDASKDFMLLVELGSSGGAAGDALRSRLTLQQAERDGGTKTTAMAVFVPRCSLLALVLRDLL